MLSLRIRHPATQRLALIVGIAAFVVVTFGISFGSMWDLWQTSDHRHGLLVFPISAFLIWRLRYTLADLPVAPDARGLLLVAPLALGWLIARLTGVQFAEHVIVLTMIPAVVATLAGPAIARRLLFPLFFLQLATPLGESLVPYLMVITADISTGLLKLSGVPFLRDGQYISLPGGEFVVADVCAGLRYLVSGVMISLLYGYLTYSSVRKRLILVALTAMAMIITNGARAYIVMAVASATSMQFLGGRDHVYFGWLMFGVILMLIMWIGARFADDEEIGDTDPSDAIAIRASHSILPIIAGLALLMLAVTLAPLQADFGHFGQAGAIIVAVAALFAFLIVMVRHRSSISHSDPGHSKSMVFRNDRRHALTSIATVLILVITPRFAVTIEHRDVDFDADLDLESLVPCTFAGPWQNDWRPGFQDADLERSASFTCGGAPMNVYVASYASALQGKELISSSHHVVPPEWDRISSSSIHTFRSQDGRNVTVAEIKNHNGVNKALVWYWYQVDHNIATGALMTKTYQVLALLRNRSAGGRVVVIETVVGTDMQQAHERLETVAKAILGAGSNFAPAGAD